MDRQEDFNGNRGGSSQLRRTIFTQNNGRCWVLWGRKPAVHSRLALSVIPQPKEIGWISEVVWEVTQFKWKSEIATTKIPHEWLQIMVEERKAFDKDRRLRLGAPGLSGHGFKHLAEAWNAHLFGNTLEPLSVHSWFFIIWEKWGRELTNPIWVYDESLHHTSITKDCIYHCHHLDLAFGQIGHLHQES